MLKIIIGLGVTALSVLIGARCSNTYKKKVEFYALFLNLNSDLKRNLSFKRENVESIVSSSKYSSSFSDLYSYLRADFETSYDEAKKILPDFLNENQKRAVIDYFLTVGKNDVEAEEKFIEYNEKVISDELEQSRNEQKKYKNMGEKLGFGLGLIVFVLIL